MEQFKQYLADSTQDQHNTDIQYTDFPITRNADTEHTNSIDVNYIAKEVWLPLEFVTCQGMVQEKALVDCGANENCMDIRTAKKLGIKPQLLDQPMSIRNVDGSDNRGGAVKHWLPIAIFQGETSHILKFIITDLGRDHLILGYPWLRDFNPKINWITKYIKGPPFLAVDATINPDRLTQYPKDFTNKRNSNPDGRAFIRHMTEEYEDNKEDLDENGEESHTFVTQYDPRKQPSAPLPQGAAERVKNELNKVEKYLDLTKTAQLPINYAYQDDFTETIKEKQARKIIETQFTSTPAQTTKAQKQLEQIMDSSPLTKIVALKEENRQQRINNQLDTIKQSLIYAKEDLYKPRTPSPLSQELTMEPPNDTPIKLNVDKAHRMLAEVKQRRLEARVAHLEEQIKPQETTDYPTPPATPPINGPNINRTTAATQWAIDTHKPAQEEELPREYQQHWRVFLEKLAQRFPPS
jgi:hypothetical protein